VLVGVVHPAQEPVRVLPDVGRLELVRVRRRGVARDEGAGRLVGGRGVAELEEDLRRLDALGLLARVGRGRVDPAQLLAVVVARLCREKIATLG
jgi:hypothetical protein